MTLFTQAPAIYKTHSHHPFHLRKLDDSVFDDADSLDSLPVGGVVSSTSVDNRAHGTMGGFLVMDRFNTGEPTYLAVSNRHVWSASAPVCQPSKAEFFLKGGCTVNDFVSNAPSCCQQLADIALPWPVHPDPNHYDFGAVELDYLDIAVSRLLSGQKATNRKTAQEFIMKKPFCGVRFITNQTGATHYINSDPAKQNIFTQAVAIEGAFDHTNMPDGLEIEVFKTGYRTHTTFGKATYQNSFNKFTVQGKC